MTICLEGFQYHLSVLSVVLISVPLGTWLLSLPLESRYAVENRIIPGFIAVGLYFLFVVIAVAIEYYRGGFRREEIEFFKRLIP